MRLDPSTHLLWILMNNDGNSAGFTLDPKTGDVDPFTFPLSPHGGGYDDLAFIAGKAFISASNPTLNGAGINVFPAVDSMVLKNGKALLTPVLLGNAAVTDTTTTRIQPRSCWKAGRGRCWPSLTPWQVARHPRRSRGGYACNWASSS
jgi:hypothetical protein